MKHAGEDLGNILGNTSSACPSCSWPAACMVAPSFRPVQVSTWCCVRPRSFAYRWHTVDLHLCDRERLKSVELIFLKLTKRLELCWKWIALLQGGDKSSGVCQNPNINLCRECAEERTNSKQISHNSEEDQWRWRWMKRCENVTWYCSVLRNGVLMLPITASCGMRQLETPNIDVDLLLF